MSLISKLTAVFGTVALSATYSKDNVEYTDSKTTLSFPRAEAANPTAADGLYTVVVAADNSIIETLVPVAPKATKTGAQASGRQSPATGFGDKVSR